MKITGRCIAVLSLALLAEAVPAQDAVTPGEFIVEPATLICAGFEWKVSGDENRNASVEVKYRQQGGAAWQTALPLLRILNERVYHRGNNIDYPIPNMFAGSVLDLQEDTVYEFQLTMSDPDGVRGEPVQRVTVRTRAEPKPYDGGRVFHVYPPGFTGRKLEPALPNLKSAFWGPGGGDWTMAYGAAVQPGDTILMHAGLYKSERYNYRDPLGVQFHGTHFIATSGTAEKPIAIRSAGDGEVILDGDGCHRLFDVAAANHLHFEGLTFRNADIVFFAGMKHIMGSSGLVVKNCRFEDIGIGVLTEHASSKNFYIADNIFLGRHDRTKLHGWSGEWLESGPAAPIDGYFAVKVYGQGHVICHNYAAYFHDGITVSTYGIPEEPQDQKCVAIDIYNNDIHLVSDNFIETDGGAHNIRVLRNRGFNAAAHALSAQPMYGGPAYFIRNVVYHVPRGGAFKFNVGPTGILAYHNTLVTEVTRSSPFSNAHLRNNLILGTGTPKRPVLDMRTHTAHTSLDYNGYRINPGEHAPFRYGAPTPEKSPDFSPGRDAAKSYRTLRELFAGAGQEQHGRLVDFDIFQRMTAPDLARPQAIYQSGNLDFRLKPGSNAVDAGCVLPNVNDGFTGRAPDLGAYEIGQAPVTYGPRTGRREQVVHTWNEQNGMISMEAEKGTGAFAVKSDPETSGGSYIYDEGAGPKCDENYTQSFTFSTVTPGKWFVFLRARKGSTTPATDDENDICMLVDGEQLYGADNVTRPVGMRVGPMAWTWTFLPKGPGGHTPDNIRNLNTHALIPAAGTHKLQFRHRSPHVSIDKIVFKHESLPDATALPTGFGPAETLR